jgi:hypothetical protein
MWIGFNNLPLIVPEITILKVPFNKSKNTDEQTHACKNITQYAKQTQRRDTHKDHFPLRKKRTKFLPITYNCTSAGQKKEDPHGIPEKN